MKTLILSCLACAAFTLTACTTEVHNHTPPVGSTTVIEKDRPVVIDRGAPAAPAVRNDIHVDAPR